MKASKRFLLGLAVAGATAAGLGVGDDSYAQSTSAQTGQSSSGDMHQAMGPGMQKMMNMPASGDVDKDFASMMKMHHQMAIDMAQVEVEKGKSSEMKSMARKIIADSKRDIGEVDKWLSGKK